jgi:hypothetical protein
MRIPLLELRRNLLSLWMAVLMSGTTIGQAEVNSEHRIGVWTIDPLMTQAQEQQVLATLNEPSEFQWKDEPLAGVVKQVGRRLPVVLHRRAIEEIGLSLETPVTAQGGETIGVALTLALRDLDLTYTIRAGSVEITTVEDAENNLLVRVYDVTPLVSFEGWPVTNRTIDVQSLADIIFTAIRPHTWESGQQGFPSMVVGDRVVMVIRQLRETHAEIQALLDTLCLVANGKKMLLPVADAVPANAPATSTAIPIGVAVSELRSAVATAQQADTEIDPDIAISVSQPPGKTMAGKPVACWSVDPLMTQQQEQQIIAALLQPAAKQWQQVPLAQVVKDLTEYFPTGIDRRALESVSISDDVSFTATVAGNPTLASVLFSGLKALDLTVRLSGGWLIITTPEAADENMAIKVYDITPMVENANGIDETMQLLRQAVGPGTWEASTMSPFTSGDRSVLIISTTMRAHLQCLALLNRLNRLGG